MTHAEFIAWLRGFSEGSGAKPTADQWKTIQEKLASVDTSGLKQAAIAAPKRKNRGG